jgi:hypothetical protein
LACPDDSGEATPEDDNQHPYVKRLLDDAALALGLAA